jgi:hypothetical protein
VSAGKKHFYILIIRAARKTRERERENDDAWLPKKKKKNERT